MENIIKYWNDLDNQLLVQIGLTILLIFLFLIVKKIISRIIRTHEKTLNTNESRTIYIIKIKNFALSLLFLVLIAMVWDVSLKGLSIYFASFFTIVGIAFFAGWSLLSNVTAYAILFFYFPFRIGSSIRIIDGDNSVEGKIEDLSIFFLKIRLSSGEIVTYPNNVALQKPIKMH